MRVEQIAFEVGRNPKTVRAFLRARFPREPRVMGSRWELDSEMVAACRRRWPVPSLDYVLDALAKIEQACEELRERLGEADLARRAS